MRLLFEGGVYSKKYSILGSCEALLLPFKELFIFERGGVSPTKSLGGTCTDLGRYL